MAVEHAAEHLVLGELLGFGFHHQHGGFRSRDDHVERRRRQRFNAGIEQVAAIGETDSRRGDGAGEWDTGDGQGRGTADQGDDVRVHVAVGGHHRGDDLHGVHEALREERADGAVDEARGERFLVARPTFTAQEAAGNLADGVELLLVVHREGKEILRRIGGGRGHHRAEHDGVAHAGHHGPGGLLGDLVGFEHHAVLAELKLFAYRTQCVLL